MQATTPLPPAAEITRNVSAALAEDIGSGDVTAGLLPSATAEGQIICRQQAILCGRAWVEESFAQLSPEIRLQWHCRDGERVEPNQIVAQVRGPAAELLSGERTALNFLQLLSAVATTTQRYVAAVAHTSCRILDTRKTIPGLRQAQKYAVACGGGLNHRLGLFDAYLIKENHIAAAGSIGAAVAAAKAHNRGLLIEVEVESLTQLEQAIAAGAQRILLDNFDISELAAAVTRANGQVPLEASGGIDLASVAQTAETGVDYISIGALTKHIQAIDTSLRLSSPPLQP